MSPGNGLTAGRDVAMGSAARRHGRVPAYCGVAGVTKPELGTKRQCQSCGARYYDLNKDPITCPKCSAVFVVETVTRRRPRPDANGAAAKPAKPKPVEVVEDVVPDSEADVAVSEE